MLLKMLNAAVALGYDIVVSYDGEEDYRGTDVTEAMDAIEACDEINVDIEENEVSVGWALIVNDLDEDERIADCSGWVDAWVDANQYD